MKRFFTLTLMLFCFILHNFAFEYTDENGVTWTWSNYDGKTGTVKDYATLTGAINYGAEVVVPEKVYNGETAYTVGCLSNTFEKSEVITKVILPKDSITIEAAFSNCYNLAEVVNSQYIISIGQSAFEGTGLKEITLPATKEIGYSAFKDCSNLTKVDLPKVSTIKSFAFVFRAL